MNELVPYRPQAPRLVPACSTSGHHSHLPGDIYSAGAILKDTYLRVEEISAEADGKWGPVGYDALTTLIPLVGAFYTGFNMLRLYRCAVSAGCSRGLRFTGFMLALIDITIGAIVGVGDLIDAFFRSSAVYGNMIKADIRRKMILIEAADMQLRDAGYLSDADVTRLRDQLFRGGRSEKQHTLRIWLSFGLMALLILAFIGG